MYTFGVEEVISEKDPTMRSMSLMLFYLVITFILAQYIVANISHSASQRLPDQRPRLETL